MKFYGQFNPPVDQIIYERYFKEDNLNKVCIECGAFDGLHENNNRVFEENFNWQCINIEPFPDSFQKLIVNRPKSTNINVALSDVNGKASFRQYYIPGYGFENNNGSICHKPEHETLLRDNCGGNYIDVEVECCTYKNLIEKFKITQVDLFILDVEGFELQVLEGMIGCDVLPQVFVIEHGHQGVGFCDEALNKLNSKYVLDFVFEVNSFYVKQDC